jgi:anaerobic selenocysteine-containing dehydrogenase
MEEALRRILERQGFRDPEFTKFEEFWSALLERGAWWDPTDTASDAASLIGTKSGRFEFYSRRLEHLFNEEVRRRAGEDPSAQRTEVERFRAALGIEADGDRLFLPHFEMPHGDPESPRFPLRLRPYLLLPLGLGDMANIPWIQEGLSIHVHAMWESWVELNPETAREAGLHEGDEVYVESPKGRVRTRVHLFEGITPGVAAMPLGQGHSALGANARGRGANPLDLVENKPDSRAGMAVLGLTPVRIEKA